MAYIVTGTCQDCKYTSCAVVCPVQAFREGPDMLFIDPDECIDCNACESECPINAISADVDLSGDDRKWIEINRVEAPKFKMIEEKRKALRGPKCINSNAGN